MLIRIGRLATVLLATRLCLADYDQVIFGGADMETLQRPEGELPTLADLLTLETRASIFYSYARETELSSQLSESVNGGITVFVPTNKAVMALSRKPHEDPEAATMTEEQYYTAAKAHVQRWVGAHIVPNTSLDFSTHQSYSTLTDGITISFKHITGAYYPSGELKMADTDAAHFASVKGSSSISTSSGSSKVDTDAAHFDSIKGPSQKAKGKAKATDELPEWKQYEINDGVHMIERKEASNGIMYIINRTIDV